MDPGNIKAINRSKHRQTDRLKNRHGKHRVIFSSLYLLHKQLTSMKGKRGGGPVGAGTPANNEETHEEELSSEEGETTLPVRSN